MAVPACCRIWPRVRLAVSAAKSVSTIRLRDADRFSVVVLRFEIVDEKRDCRAPKAARCVLTADRAASAILMASWAPSKVVTSSCATDFRVDTELVVLRPEPLSVIENDESES